MRRIIFFFVLSLGGVAWLSAQSLDRFVIGSTGAFGTNATNQVEYTVGELVTTTVSNANFVLNQGFHQTNPPYNTDLEAALSLTSRLYPNPTSGTAILELDSSDPQQLTLEIWDLQGRRLQVEREVLPRSGNREIEINLSGEAEGVYFLRLSSAEGGFLQTFRLEKR